MKLFTFCCLICIAFLCWFAYDCGLFDCQRPIHDSTEPSPVLKVMVRGYAAAFQELDRQINGTPPKELPREFEYPSLLTTSNTFSGPILNTIPVHCPPRVQQSGNAPRPPGVELRTASSGTKLR